MTDKRKKFPFPPPSIPWYGWAATIREIREGIPPHRPTLIEALRGNEPVPEEVRAFLANFFEGKWNWPPGRQPQSVIDKAMDDDYLRVLVKDEQELAEGGWTPSGVSRRDDHLAGTPVEVGRAKAAIAAAEKGMVGKAGKPLAEETIKKRASRSGRSKRRKKK